MPCAPQELLTMVAVTVDATVSLRTQFAPMQLTVEAGGVTGRLWILVLVLPAASVTVSLTVNVVSVATAYEWMTGLPVGAVGPSPKFQTRDWKLLPT